MNNNFYKLLLVGNINDNHIIRLIRNLKGVNPDVLVDVFSKHACMPISDEVCGLVNKVFVANVDKRESVQASFWERLKRHICTLRCLYGIKGDNYDVINIHYPTWTHLLYIFHLKKENNKVLLTPWGSDVYRANKKLLFLLKNVYKKADFVCGTKNRFSRDVKQLFDLKEDKIAYLDIGSETIDYISERISDITREDAKDTFGVKNKYVITCGYNGAKAQNHREIIDAIDSIKHIFNQDVILFFPFTYAGTRQYEDELISILNKKNIEYRFFDVYLELNELYLLRRSTDLFIHVQTTDANAATIQEYILCGTKIINGEWLRYSELERDGVIPYYIVDSLEKLADTIEVSYHSNSIKVPESTLDYIRSYGWRKWAVKWDAFFRRITH